MLGNSGSPAIRSPPRRRQKRAAGPPTPSPVDSGRPGRSHAPSGGTSRSSIRHSRVSLTAGRSPPTMRRHAAAWLTPSHSAASRTLSPVRRRRHSCVARATILCAHFAHASPADCRFSRLRSQNAERANRLCRRDLPELQLTFAVRVGSPRQGGGHWFEPSIAHSSRRPRPVGLLRRARGAGQSPDEPPMGSG